MAIAETVVIDCSLLAHALIPTQQTPDAIAAFDEIHVHQHIMVAPAVLFSEFPSLVRKLVNRRTITREEGNAIFDEFRFFAIDSINVTQRSLMESWDLATRLGQSDTFDSMAYVVAVDQGATLWTCDRRFANAARASGLPSFRYFE